MSAAWFCAFLLKPDVIDNPGKYVTRCGEVVEVDVVSKKHDFKCRGKYSCGTAEGWHKSGRLYFGQECDNDIVGKA